MLLEGYDVIYGGSFNPPHMGHFLVCSWLIEALKVSTVYLVPVYEHNFGKKLASFEHRMKMCNIMRSPFGNEVVLDDIEKDLPKPNTTYDLLQAYRKAYKIKKKKSNDVFAVVIGSEILEELDKWHRWQELPDLARIVVVERSGFSKGVSPVPVLEYPMLLPSTSSSEVRHRLAEGKSIDGLVPYKIAEYIEKHRLYRGK